MLYTKLHTFQIKISLTSEIFSFFLFFIPYTTGANFFLELYLKKGLNFMPKDLYLGQAIQTTGIINGYIYLEGDRYYKNTIQLIFCRSIKSWLKLN